MSESDTTHRMIPPVSAYIRTLNEKRMIAEVVRAALTVAREVIVVDSGSTDGTIELARGAGATVVHQDWLGNGGQKRVGEDRALYDWVLDIDADEVVTPEFADEVAALFEKGEPPHAVYNTPLVNVPPVGAPWYGYGQSVRHKLYNKTKIRIPDHKAWDQFKIPSDMKIGKLKHAILHYAFDGAELFITKVNKNSSTRAEHVKDKPLFWLYIRILLGFWIYFGKRYFVNGLWRGGLYGFAFAFMSGFGKWLRDVKMYERIMKERGQSLYTDEEPD
ncbi:glycosyltransferase family 2 protein [Parvularcula flava]|uniref:Beta 1,4 glucosyltransferase n=1 Tax=Aquisalinus luteolus TaxID=1566827 RepID=A0A8J3A443_9PROT|nr:glycosyltransferase family 2 protein [Aquisalinus luteolus]NHK28312.1 glycosyltransferase family 2 protein [Aquisalinus luteolus]GGH98096.1 beta 1,4 glucosyltransferase [Aquisalinus luteolus]